MTREQLETLMAWVEATVAVQAARCSAGPHVRPLRAQQVAARERLLAMVSDEPGPRTTDPNESLDVQLRRLWIEEKRGVTYIARKLGITRSSVLGRVHRMKKLWEKADPNEC